MPPPASELLWHAATAACVKLLLVPSYRSTDFEVHRHWLTLSHSLPVARWYSDETSPWTIDYPPFFAFLALLLSFPARAVDPVIVHLHRGLGYGAASTSGGLTTLIGRRRGYATLVWVARPRSAVADSDLSREDPDLGRRDSPGRPLAMVAAYLKSREEQRRRERKRRIRRVDNCLEKKS